MFPLYIKRQVLFFDKYTFYLGIYIFCDLAGILLQIKRRMYRNVKRFNVNNCSMQLLNLKILSIKEIKNFMTESKALTNPLNCDKLHLTSYG